MERLVVAVADGAVADAVLKERGVPILWKKKGENESIAVASVVDSELRLRLEATRRRKAFRSATNRLVVEKEAGTLIAHVELRRLPWGRISELQKPQGSHHNNE
jgi:hypothetical protein